MCLVETFRRASIVLLELPAQRARKAVQLYAPSHKDERSPKLKKNDQPMQKAMPDNSYRTQLA